MQKKFVTNLALLLFLNLLIKGFYILVIEVGVQNRVGTESFGTYFALLNFSFLLNILLDVGITNFNNKNIAQNNHLLSKHFSSIVVLKLLLACAYLFISLGIGLVIGYDMRLMKLFLYLGLNQFLISFVLYLRSNLAGLHLFKTDSAMSVLDRGFMILFCGFLLWSSWAPANFDVMLFVYAQTASYVVQALIVFFIVLRKAEFLRLKWDYPFALMILKKSFPFAVLVLLMTFYNRIDTVMLERMLPDGAQQCGVYASAYRILDATNMVAFLFAGLLLPMFAKMLKLQQPVEDMVKLATSLLIVPAIIIAVGSFTFRTEIMEKLYHDHVIESAAVFGKLMFCFVAISTTYIFGTLLTANGNLKEMNIMACSGIIINILLNVLLIPKLKATGSAYASLTTQFLTAMAQVFMVQYIFRFRMNLRFLFALLIFGGLVFVIFSYSHQLLPNWIMALGTGTAVAFATAFAFRLISIKGLVNIMKFG
jgi:O-antigen/teichoic acid export membrane protein